MLGNRDRRNCDFGHSAKLFMTTWNSLPVWQEYITLRIEPEIFSVTELLKPLISEPC